MTLETGKPLCESVDCIDWVAACFEYLRRIARSTYGNSIPPVAPHQLNFTIKEPYGVVAAIVPFNFPLLLMAWKVAPAISAGNTVVCKPPHQNPLSNLLLAQVYDVLPPGVVNVVTGGEADRRRPRGAPGHRPGRLHRLDGGRASDRSRRGGTAEKGESRARLGRSVHRVRGRRPRRRGAGRSVGSHAERRPGVHLEQTDYIERPIADAFLRRLEAELALSSSPIRWSRRPMWVR